MVKCLLSDNSFLSANHSLFYLVSHYSISQNLHGLPLNLELNLGLALAFSMIHIPYHLYVTRRRDCLGSAWRSKGHIQKKIDVLQS